MGVISGRILECYFPPPFYSLPPGEGKATFYEFVKNGALNLLTGVEKIYKTGAPRSGCLQVAAARRGS